jgi:hypothetical protein
MSNRSSLLDLKSWATLPAYALVFLLVVFPMIPALLPAKALLLAVILAAVAVATLATGHSGIHPTVALWTLSLSLLGFLFVLEGFFTGAPGAGKTVGVYVIWPIIYVLMIAGVRNKRILSGLIGTFIISTIFIGIYSIVYLLIQTNVLPESRYFDLISFDWDAQAFGLDEGYYSMQYPGLNSLPFLIPFSLAALITCPRHIEGAVPLHRVGLWVAVLLGLASVALSGRRALFLVTLTTPALTLLFVRFQPIVQRRSTWKALVRVTACVVLAVVILLFCLNASYGIGFTGLTDRLSIGFDFSPTTADQGANERRRQFHALLAGWMENPILGAGHGSPAYGSIRSEKSPWSYELYYMALLYQTGLFGITAYAAGIFWIYWVGVRVIRSGGYLSGLMVACLVGMSSILIANATNPYLDGFDAMWAIFFPLALINFWLVRRAAPRLPALHALGIQT